MESFLFLQESVTTELDALNVQIEYVSGAAPVRINDDDVADSLVTAEFVRIFGKFASAEQLTQEKIKAGTGIAEGGETALFGFGVTTETEPIEEEEDKESNAVKKKKFRMQVSDLKQKVLHPEVVEVCLIYV